jgi:tetratricopeptide (TPR) repeat protein
MPSIEAVEQFKAIVKNLANEPQIRATMGMPAEEILPPESGLTDDLADLLGGMPQTSSAAADEAEGRAVELDSDLTSEEDGTELDDLLAAPVPQFDEPETGPSLDDLLGPAPTPPPEDLVANAEADPFADLFATDPPDIPADPFADLLAPTEDAEPLPQGDPFAGDADPFATEADPFAGGADPFPDLLAPEAAVEEAEDLDTLGGVDSFDMPPDPFADAASGDASADDPFGNAFGGDFPDPAGASGEEEFQFAGDAEISDFPELAGFADTKEEDVEAFDSMGVADEFGLGDFESQFGITADDHTDPELLNPAQSIDLEIEQAQKTLSLSEEEFTTIQQVLNHLPLNLKLAVEELIGEKEMVFEDLDKVVGLLIGRAPARTIASAVGKILGRKILIPPGFEKGSGEEIEARHATLWYNMRTIMFPIVRLSVVVTAVAAVLVLLGWNFLVKPWKANDWYDQGLAQIKLNNGAEADQLFAQAYYEWPVQDRFFQYAEAYQDTGDFERSRRKYLELLQPSVKPFLDNDKARLKLQYVDKLAPLPDNLSDADLAKKLADKNKVLDAWYAYVFRLLSEGKDSSLLIDGDVAGEVLWGNPVEKGLLDYSKFETDYGFEGLNKNAHYQRADKVLEPLFQTNVNHKVGLLRKGDNQLTWAEDLTSADHRDAANSAFSNYLQAYGKDAPITWRFVKLFLIEDSEEELLKLEDGVLLDKKLATDGEVVARLAQWLLDRDALRKEERANVPQKVKTIEEEYGIRPALIPEVEEPVATAEAGASKAPAAEPAAPTHSIARSEGGGGETKAAATFDPPYKYPNSTEPFAPDYLDGLDTLVLRAMETQKELPELHFQLSRYYRVLGDPDQEKMALSAADTYFLRMKPRMLRLNDRPAMRVATLNRIGEVFVAREEPLQAEQYFLQAQTQLEESQSLGLLSLTPQTAQVYRNLGNLYYLQTPGTAEAEKNPGGWEEALKLFETARKGQLEDPAVTYRMGVILYEKKEYAAAIKEFFELDKKLAWRDNWNLLYAMANTLFRNGNYYAAEGYYRELLAILLDKRATIVELNVAGKRTDRALAQRIFQVWSNLGATLYRGSHAFKAGTREFRESLAALTTAEGMAVTLGLDLYGSRKEFDITLVNDSNIQALRDEQARIVAQTRKDKGLVEANLQVLALVETTPPGRRGDLIQDLEIFAGLPLELDQLEAP